MNTTEQTVLRVSRGDDLQALLAVQQACADAPQWSAAIWSDLLHGSSDRGIFVAERGDALVGFIVVAAVAGGAELESVAVVRDHRGCGLGRALCARGITWAAEAGAHEMLLEVRASNAAAVGLYRSLGFAEQGRRRGYYSAPVEDALLMALSLRAQAAANATL